jgi:hypothetical protein
VVAFHAIYFLPSFAFFLAIQPLLVESLPKSFCQQIKVNIFDRCGTLTQGKIKNRMLLVRNLRLAFFVLASRADKVITRSTLPGCRTKEKAG